MAELGEAGPAIRVKLEDHEVGLLRSLLEEMRTLLEAGIAGDPVNRRLFPDAYESADESRGYRDLVGDELRSGKLAAVHDMQSALEARTGDAVELSKDEAARWLPVLTDLRLAIGTRNEVTEERMAEDIDPEDPESAGMLVLHWLGWLQESLLEKLTRIEEA